MIFIDVLQKSNRNPTIAGEQSLTDLQSIGKKAMIKRSEKRSSRRRLAPLATALTIALTACGPLIAQQAYPCITEEEFPGEVKLIASDGQSYDVFGDGVAVGNGVAMVGAPSGTGSDPGAVYVYERRSGHWPEVQILEPSDGIPGDRFGQSIAITGDLAIIGAIHALNTGPGAAYVFRKTASGWIEEQKLTASDAASADSFGRTVAIAPDMALVGASFHDHNGSNSGAVFIYHYIQGSWIETQEILAPDGAVDDHFGGFLSRSDDRLVVGASGDDNYMGSVYVFEYDGRFWTFTQKLTAPDGVSGDGFGVSVAMSGDKVLVGASQTLSGGTGVAYAFEWNGIAWTWKQKLTSSDAVTGDKFGVCLAMRDDVAVIGAPFDDDSGNGSGAAYFFLFDGAVWHEREKLLASDGAAGHYFGTPLSLSGRAALIGAPLGNGKEPSSGAAYIFDHTE